MSSLLSKLLVLMVFVIFVSCESQAEDDSEETRKALKALQRAAQSYPLVKTYRKNAESYLFQRSPIDKSDLVYFSPLAAIIDKRLSTKKFKNLVWKRDSLVVDPDVTYAYTEQFWLMSLNITYTF